MHRISSKLSRNSVNYGVSAKISRISAGPLDSLDNLRENAIIFFYSEILIRRLSTPTEKQCPRPPGASVSLMLAFERLDLSTET